MLDGEKGERPIYFVSKVLKGAELCYHTIEKLALVVVVMAMKLRHYLQGHPITVKANYQVKQVLKKPDLAGRMVSWAVELLKYDITFKS